MKYEGEEFNLNIIDTPGHVDFSYEVSRSLSACDGVILLVDATQGIEAQTLAHYNLATELKLKIIPVIKQGRSSVSRYSICIKDLSELTGVSVERNNKSKCQPGLGIDDLINKYFVRYTSTQRTK